MRSSFPAPAPVALGLVSILWAFACDFGTGPADPKVRSIQITTGASLSTDAIQLAIENNIDILFLDADKQGYLDYLDQLLPLVRPGGALESRATGMPPSRRRRISTCTSSRPVPHRMW